MIKAKTSLKVRFAETDAMGVVYHANYLPWCECARLALIEGIGLNYAEMTKKGFHLPVVEVRVKYRRPARFGDTVEIESAIIERPSVKIKIEYKISAGGILLAEAQTVHVFVNSEGAPIKPPREYAQTLLKAFDENPGE